MTTQKIRSTVFEDILPLTIFLAVLLLCPLQVMGQSTGKDLIDEDDWLVVPDMKPNDAIAAYQNQLTIKGEAMQPDVNCRVVIYGSGSAIIPHAKDYAPLSVFTERHLTGSSQQMTTNYWYTNKKPEKAPADRVKALTHDNAIRSLRLKKGYMATLATAPNGMGYSQVVVADTGDLVLDTLPMLLDRKISFIRVTPWQYVTKKGWAGSKWTAVPEGLKYVEEQCDYTNSTWYYNWSASTGWTTNPNRTGKSYNQEFVPEIWGKGSTFEEAYSLCDVSHLMGYNEPDHTEQSNVSVEQAIEEWPYLMQTGLRLGSPATTNFSWLYNFMKEARQRNYRVDYVVVHAYWGGLSGQEWYEKLKTVHETTGRPIWIKEWNNGANWTSESWPSGTADQQAKQLRDLKSILTVMDTCSFIERYSIYNWVQDKRAVILSDGSLTPAGEYYRDDASSYFFRHEGEVQTDFAVRSAPVLNYSEYRDGKLHITWTDENMEMIQQYVVEKSEDGKTYTTVKTIDVSSCASDSLEGISTTIDIGDASNIYVRVCSFPIKGAMQTSNAITACLLNNSEVGTSQPYLGQTQLDNNWRPAIFSVSYPTPPVVVLGTATYRVKQPYTVRVRNVQADNFDLAIRSWDYQLNPTLYYNDTLAVMSIPEGHDRWGKLEVESGTVSNIGSEWRHVSFQQAFQSVPVVIPTQVTDCFSSASSPRIKNVTTEGFDLHLQYEGTLRNDSVPERVSYFAAEVGKGEINGCQVTVGRTAEGAVEDKLLGGTTVEYGTTFTDVPLCFAAMQTEADTITSVLRILSRNNTQMTLFKQRETSVARERVTPEQVGFILVGKDQTVGITSPNENRASTSCQTFDLQGRMVDKNHAKGIVLVRKTGGKIEKKLQKGRIISQ